jgi:flavodoxin/NAD-dependent dihydropyrimidine dehydrogenase PreA subunit
MSLPLCPEARTMAKCLIVYFSQGGTTAQVAECIAGGLRGEGYSVDLGRLGWGGRPQLDGYDMLGIGTPVYYYRPPFIVTDFLNGLGELHGLPAFVFLLHGTYPWETGRVIRHTLNEKGARVVGCFRSYGIEHWVGYLNEGYVFSPGHPSEAELAKAEAFGREVGVQARVGAFAESDEDAIAPLVYRIERLVTNRWLATHVYSRLFRVDERLCDSCGLCVEQCPTGNISIIGDGGPTWGRNCLLCLTCEMKCPTRAITSPASWRLFRPIVKYNARCASRDSSIDHERVDPNTWVPLRLAAK